MANKSFTEMLNTLTNNKLESATKKRMMECYAWSIATYGCELCENLRTLSKQSETWLLKAMEMWIYRCMKKISWTDKKSKKEVVRKTRTRTGPLFFPFPS